MITATGIGSGLDIEGLVTQLVAAERAPTENRLVRQDARLTSELSAFGIFKNALSSLQNSIAELNNPGSFGQHISTSSDEGVVEVSASADAIPGSYDLGVTQLAKAHSLASAAYSSPADAVGTGVMTIRFGSTDYVGPTPGPESYNGFTVNPDRGVANITIDASNNSLEGIRDAINDADIGISAAIVNDGSGYRLLLNSEQSGEENSIEISVDDTGDGNDIDAGGLSALAFSASATNLSQTVAAQDAIFTINGLTINSAENQVDGAIEGVNITLKDVSGAAPVAVSVAEDRASVKEAINNFVEGYNSFIQTTNGLTAYDAATGSAGALQGDFSVRSIAGQLRQVFSNPVAGLNGPFGSLSEIGITTESDGTLAVDSAELDSVLEEHYDDIAGLFAAVGLPSDLGVEVVGSSSETIVGSYSVEVSQLATRGQLLGNVAAFPLDIDADNDGFTIQVNGLSSAPILLTQGSYASGAELAAEIQSRINGDSTLANAGARVTVVFNVDHFEITSESYGSQSNVEITAVDTNSATELGLTVAAGTAGVNVAGTIGGLTATGVGQVLKAQAGSDAEGLQLRIESGALGPRGTVDFSRGVSNQLNTLLSSFLESDGVLESRTDGIQERVTDIEDQRETLDRRMVALEAQYRARFTVLDSLLSQLQTTSSFLTQQLASLPEPGSLNKK